MEELKGQAEESHGQALEPLTMTAASYMGRGRAYLSWLIFVVVVGLPIIGVPTLRERLRSRIQMLRDAATSTGVRYQMVTVRADEKRGPFPAQYDKPAPPPSRPKPIVMPVRPPQARMTQPKEQREPQTSPPPVQESVPEEPKAEGQEPRFSQGKIEQQVYELLLESDQAPAALVTGSDPSLRFKSWGAAKAEEDAWLVRVTMTYLPDGSDREYIWKVKVLSKEIVPMSAYARTLSKS